MTIITPRADAAPQASVTPTPSAPPQEAPVVEAKEEQLSPKFLALAKQQKALRRQQLEIKQREDAFSKREADLKALESRYQTDYVQKSRLKEDPMGVLNESGLTYDQLVNAQLSKDPVQEAMKPLEAKLAALEEANKKANDEAVERQKRDYDQAVNHVRNEVKMLVDGDPEFETIVANDAQEAVVELIKETFEKDGTLLTAKEAATQIEDWLLDQAVKMAGLEKVKKRLAPAETVTDPLAKAVSQQKQQPKTLSNATTTAQTKPLSSKEKRERAIAAFRGQLPPS